MIPNNIFRDKKIDGLIDEIDQLISLDFSNLQSWKATHRDWKVGESRSVQGSGNTKIYQNEIMMRFFTVIPPLVEFPDHWHDCVEICQIQAGVLGDKKTGARWHVNQTAVFPKGIPHIPYNPSPDTSLYMIVEFYK